jgi:nucleoid DNA-binding protein
MDTESVMMVEKHICKILRYGNDVVIPSFGILKATYAPASIHLTQHLFSPPYKSLSFHKDSKINDAKLILSIVSEEHISEDTARKMIENLVKDIHESLINKGNYLMEEIGKFYLDVEKQLRFTAGQKENFLLSSYGLNDFVSPPILRPKNIPTNSPTTSLKEKKKRRFIWFRF